MQGQDTMIQGHKGSVVTKWCLVGLEYCCNLKYERK